LASLVLGRAYGECIVLLLSSFLSKSLTNLTLLCPSQSGLYHLPSSEAERLFPNGLCFPFRMYQLYFRRDREAESLNSFPQKTSTKSSRATSTPVSHPSTKPTGCLITLSTLSKPSPSSSHRRTISGSRISTLCCCRRLFGTFLLVGTLA
jgi:hypothetical protein